MIRIRVDDVMTDSSQWGRSRAIRRICAFQRWIDNTAHVIYVPTILVANIQEFPEVIANVREATFDRRAFPELHGYEHIDYAKLSLEEIRKHLDNSFIWMDEHLSRTPKVWCTPWGASGGYIKEAAKEFDLEVETTDWTIDVKKAVTLFRRGASPQDFEDKTILEHWWNRGSALLRFLECVKYGSYEAAEKWDIENRPIEGRIF